MPMIRIISTLALLLATCGIARASTPRLVVQLVVSSMRAEDLDRYAANFSDDGFLRLVRSGTRYTVSCSQGEKVSGHRPSVDALFFSMAEQVRCKMVGIIMTGMGRDGADGLLQMRKAGAYTIGQDKESSVVYGMPMVAQNIGAVKIQASCENIASVLLRQLNQL